MDSTEPNVYVAELLQQLEDLKRKKACRLQKLKKLKKTPSHQETSARGASCHIDQNTTKSSDKQPISASKCDNCQLSLVSKDSLCVKCISVEYKENTETEEAKNSGTTLDVEPLHTKFLETAKSKISAYEQEINTDGSVIKVKNEESTVLETLVTSGIFSTSGTICSSEISHNQRKRTSIVVNGYEEREQYESKRVKFSEKVLLDANRSNIGSLNGNSLTIANIDSSVTNKSKENPQCKGSLDANVESSSHISCFLSTIPKKRDNKIKKANYADFNTPFDPDESINDVNLKERLKTVEIFSKEEIHSIAKSNAHMPAYRSEGVNAKELLSEQIITSNSKGKLEMSYTTIDKVNLNEISLKDVDSISPKKEQTVDEELFCGFVPLNESIKKCLVFSKTDVEVNKCKFSSYRLDKLNTKVDATKTNEVVLSDSQLLKDFESSDFSSFENSNGSEKAQKLIELENNKTVFCDTLISTSAKPKSNAENFDNFSLDKIPSENVKKVEGNVAPNVLESKNKTFAGLENEKVSDENDVTCIPETTTLNYDNPTTKTSEAEYLFDDGLTEDLDFDCTSLEVADTVKDLLTKSNRGPESMLKKPAVVLNGHSSINVLELNPQDGDLYTIPETMQLEIPQVNESEINDVNNFESTKESEKKCSVIGQTTTESHDDASCIFGRESQAFVGVEEDTQCDNFDQLQTIQDTVFLNSEDSLALGNYTDIPFIDEKIERGGSSDLEDATEEDQDKAIKFLCSLQGDVDEPVVDVKLVTFNSSCYVFIQHVTWIQVWRQEKSKQWIKIFSHQVDDKLTLKEMCFTKDNRHLILIMLLRGDQLHCLQFLLFESEARVIKLMEHTHWMHSRFPEETVLICGLGDLKFATAQGKDQFEVFVHIFSSLRDEPRLAVIPLGLSSTQLHSLCSIEGLPNALMGTSHSTLHVWHLLEARLVTFVELQLPDQLVIEKCVWATIESGLVFLVAVCIQEDSFRSCQLLATNLATGFCQVTMAYSFVPAEETPCIQNKQLKAVYNEPLLAASCDDGCFLWSVSGEYCCASLKPKADATAVYVGHDQQDGTLIAVGSASGCVNCYSLKCN